MLFLLHQSPKVFNFWFQNASEFPSLSTRYLDTPVGGELFRMLLTKRSECDVIIRVHDKYFHSY